MSYPYELDFEWQLESYVLKAQKAPAAKLKWDKQRTLWKMASEKSPISRPKVLNISRHNNNKPGKNASSSLPHLPMLPMQNRSHHQRHKTPKDIGEEDSKDVDDATAAPPPPESQKLPKVASADPKPPPPPPSTQHQQHRHHHHHHQAILAPLNKGHHPITSTAYSASYAAYASICIPNPLHHTPPHHDPPYLPSHLRVVPTEVFSRLSKPKKLQPNAPLPKDVEEFWVKKKGKKASKNLFERLHGEGKVKEQARKEKAEEEEKQRHAAAAKGDERAIKELVERLAVPKPHVDPPPVEKKEQGGKVATLSPKDLERLAMPKYRVVWKRDRQVFRYRRNSRYGKEEKVETRREEKKKKEEKDGEREEDGDEDKDGREDDDQDDEEQMQHIMKKKFTPAAPAPTHAASSTSHPKSNADASTAKPQTKERETTTATAPTPKDPPTSTKPAPAPTSDHTATTNSNNPNPSTPPIQPPYQQIHPTTPPLPLSNPTSSRPSTTQQQQPPPKSAHASVRATSSSSLIRDSVSASSGSRPLSRKEPLPAIRALEGELRREGSGGVGGEVGLKGVEPAGEEGKGKVEVKDLEEKEKEQVEAVEVKGEEEKSEVVPQEEQA
ncbi:hypothetical protein HDU97_001550 [Phlyctochytrium planicorne]|nr:hypothetical protein HDU97_001550 [Phlyctochytrium planicorne]